jgi:hypothetical protein
VRTFANPSGITCAPGAIGTLLSGAFTFAAIIRRTSDNDFHSLISLESASGHRGGLWVTNGGGSGGDLQVVSSGFDTSFGFTIPNNVTAFVAATKDDGDSITPNGWLYRYDTDTWSTAAGVGTINEDSDTITTLRVGNWEGTDFWYIGDIGIDAGWSRALTDAQIRQLPFSLQAWYASAPTFGHLLDQQATGQNVIDWTGGGANQTALSNTSVSTTSLPVFSYGFDPVAPHSAPAGGADATPTPAATATVTSLPAATVSAGSTAAPASTAAVVALPAAAKSAGSTLTPAATAAVVSLPAATVHAAATVTPAATAVVVGLPAAAAGAAAIASPQPIAAAVSLPAAAVSAGATVTPAAIAAAVSIPTATRSAGATVTPAVFAVTVALPQATVQAGGSATVTPQPAAVFASLPAAGLSASSTVTPAVFGTTVSLPAAMTALGIIREPAAIAAATALPATSRLLGATTTPATIPALAGVPTPTIPSQEDARGPGGYITASTPSGRITTSTPPRYTTSTGGGRL